MINYTERLCEGNPLLQSAYYYFSFSDEAKQDLDNCLASMIIQLCSRRPAPQSLRNIFVSRKSGRPTTEQLISVLQELIGSCEHTYILLDALDECPEAEDQRASILNFIQELCSGSASSRLHLLILSRAEADIRQVLVTEVGAVEMSVSAEKVRHDIMCHVRNQLLRPSSSTSKLPAELVNRIVERVAARAAGM